MQTENPIPDVIEKLTANGHDVAAREIQLLAQEMLSPDEAKRIAAANALLARCDVRWLGDLRIADMDFAAWTRLLERMGKFAKRYKL